MKRLMGTLAILVLASSCEVRPDVKTVRLERGEVRQSIRFVGKTQSGTKRLLSAPYDGRVDWIEVVVGQRVDKGQVLVKMRTKDLEEKLAKVAHEVRSLTIQKSSLTAQLKKTESDLQRAKAALRSRAIASSDVEATQVQRVVDENRLKAIEMSIAQSAREMASLREQVQASSLEAPISGMISESWSSKADFTAGAMVKAGDPLVTIVESTEMRVKAAVPEYFVSQLNEGQKVRIASPSQAQKSWVGDIQSIASSSRSDGIFDVVIHFQPEPGSLRIGSEVVATATVAYRESALFLPKTAVMKVGDDYFVNRVNGGQASRVKVSVGIVGDDRVEIIANVAPTDDIAQVFL